jgi:ribonuclease J
MTQAASPLTDGTVRFLPLGGLGEIGLNMAILETTNDLLIIDCGLMFPEQQMLGVDLVLPDICSLEGRLDKLRGLLLTHGHEDHIGAIPFLIERLGFPPIYGTPLTLGLLENKLAEHQLIENCQLRPVTLRTSIALGDFAVEFFRAAHSIVDGAGLAIRTPAGIVIHSGDFKLDPTPVDGEQTDLARLAALGDEGVALLLADSTNVENSGHTLSEKTVGEAFREIIPRCSGKIIVATFSSNIHRIQQLADATSAAGRKLLISGRSMLENVAIARRLGYLSLIDDDLVELKRLPTLKPEQVLILTTGSQGEPLSALTRIAMDDHKQIRLDPGDTVILSSKFIPGNEKAIAELINHLYRRGAEVYYEKTSEIHVSGHAAREELKTLHSLVRPDYFVPVHGEYRHLVKHVELARELGMPDAHTLVLENGSGLLLSANGVAIEAKVETGRVFVDGKGVGDVGVMEMRDRRHLANHGIVTVIMALNQASGEIVYGPELFTRGFIPEEESRAYLSEAAGIVRATLSEHSSTAVSDWEELRVEVRKNLRRFFNRTKQRRPLILPIIMGL